MKNRKLSDHNGRALDRAARLTACLLANTLPPSVRSQKSWSLERKAAAEVATWPQWKRDAADGVYRPQRERKRRAK